MKRFLLASVAIAAITVSSAEVALPADLAPVYKAPAPIVARDLWTGFYAGVHFGGAWGTKEFSDPFDPSFTVSNTVNGYFGGVRVVTTNRLGGLLSALRANSVART